MDELSELLASLNMIKYRPKFDDNNVDFKTLKTMTEEDQLSGLAIPLGELVPRTTCILRPPRCRDFPFCLCSNGIRCCSGMFRCYIVAIRLPALQQRGVEEAIHPPCAPEAQIGAKMTTTCWLQRKYVSFVGPRAGS